MKTSKVALIVESTLPPITRANLRLYMLGLALREKEHDVYMVSPCFRSFRSKRISWANLSIVQHPGFSQFLYKDGMRLVVRLFHLVCATFVLIQLARRKDAQVLHAWHPIASLSSVIAGRLTHTRVFLDWTDFYSDIAQYESPILAPVFRTIESIIGHWSDQIFTVTEEMKSSIMKMGVDGTKIHVIHDGVDAVRFSPTIDGSAIRARYGIGNSPVVMFHGDVKPIDGVDILIESFKLVLERIPTAKLMIVGGGGKYFEKLKTVAKSHGTLSSIIFTGWAPHEDVPKYIAAADLGVMPLRSTLETNSYLSFKIFEYWSSAKPVVVSRLKAIGRVAKNDINSLIVDPLDVQGFANSICSLLSDRDKATRLGKNGRQLVEHEFQWSYLMDEESSYYE